MSESYLIERMSYGSDAISHTADGKTVFLSGCAAVGDTVLAQTYKEKKHFVNARIEQISQKGPHHIDSPCEAPCGGCPWRAMDYETQVEEKQQNVAFNLSHGTGLDEPIVQQIIQPIVLSPSTCNYRNKVEFGIDLKPEGILLGMSEQSSDVLTPLTICNLLPQHMEQLPKALRGALRMVCKQDTCGLFRIGIRYSERTGQCELALWTTPGAFPRNTVRTVLPSAFKSFGGLASIVRVIAEPGKQRRVKRVEVLEGNGYWEEELRVFGRKYRYRTSAPSFFQVNTAAADLLVEDAIGKLVSVASDGGSLAGKRIADLYAGGGTFSIPLAALGADVIAVESASSSVKDMRRNAELNHVALECVGGDSARELPKLGVVDALIVDPPRAGLAAGVVDDIARLAPRAVVYVSCDPVTLCRDLKLFRQAGYELLQVTPHDLFPQTYHVETVVLLVKQSIAK